MTVTLKVADGFAERLLADARDGLAQYAQLTGHPLTGAVLDIGAHYGAFTLEALEAGASYVLCIEPIRVNYEALLANLSANAIPIAHRQTTYRARPLNAAVVEDTAVRGAPRMIAVRHAVNGNSGQYSVVFHEGHPVADLVPIVTFSDLLSRDRWAIVKIDVEGGEWSFLQQREKAVELLMAQTEFLDLEIHPLDAPEYYPATPRDQYAHVDEVGEWFQKAGHRVTWTVQHPTRLYIVARDESARKGTS